jgi:hypothetical protein
MNARLDPRMVAARIQPPFFIYAPLTESAAMMTNLWAR